MGTNNNWDDNLAKVAIYFFKLVKEFKWAVSIAIVGSVFALGWLDVEGFQAITDGLTNFVKASIGAVIP